MADTQDRDATQVEQAEAVDAESGDAEERDPNVELLAYIKECEHECAEAQLEVDSLASDLKAARHVLEKAIEKLRAAARGDDMPLFDRAAGDTPPDPEAWRKVPTSELGIAEGTVTIMKEVADIETLGGLTDFLGDGKSDLSNIKGIGEAKAEKIEDELATWWEKHPEMNAAPEFANLPELDPNEPFTSQCGYTSNYENFTFTKDGKSYICPHCNVEFEIDRGK